MNTFTQIFLVAAIALVVGIPHTRAEEVDSADSDRSTEKLASTHQTVVDDVKSDEEPSAYGAPLLTDPLFRKGIKIKLEEQLWIKYFRFFEKINLPFEDRVRFIDLLLSRKIASLTQAQPRRGEAIESAGEKKHSRRQSPLDLSDSGISAILGVPGEKALLHFEETIPARRAVEKFQRHLEFCGKPMSTSQAETMIEAIYSARRGPGNKTEKLEALLSSILGKPQFLEYKTYTDNLNTVKEIEARYGPVLGNFDAK